MISLFDECQSLVSLPDISNWITDNVTEINYMFRKCQSLKLIPDISKRNTVYNKIYRSVKLKNEQKIFEG